MPSFPLGNIPSPHDPNDVQLERYTAALIPPMLRARLWPDPRALIDQGAQGICGGAGAAQWCNVLPVSDGFDIVKAKQLYQLATKYDGHEDDPFLPGGGQQGTTPRSVAKALKEWGRLGSYAFTKSQNTMIQWVLLKGPLMIGIQWTRGMFTPDAKGFIHPTGPVEGGHFLVIDGVELDFGRWRLLNSWVNEDGSPWGIGGRCYMEFPEFATNFRAHGECLAGLELPLAVPA